MKKITTITVLMLQSILTTAVAMENFTQLDTLITQKNYQQAWQQAQKLASTHEGDPRFDYLYGLAALETGNYDKAVFALDRVTVNQPNAMRPRLELARAYLKIKNDRAALREFEEVLRLNPPAAVQRTINRYIQAINKKPETNRKWVMSGLLSLAAGYDTNNNFGATQSAVETPLFGSVTLNESSLKQGSPALELRGQLKFRYITSDAHSWFINTQLGHKHFTDSGDFNLSGLTIRAGSVFTTDKQQYQLGLQYQTMHLGGESFSRTTGLEGGVAWDLQNNRTLSTQLSIGDYDHQQQASRDARQYSLSTRYQYGSDNTRHQFEWLLGQGKPNHENGEHHTHKMIGAGYSVRHAWDNTHTSILSLNYQTRKHRAANPIYNTERKDQRWTVKAGHSMRLGKEWSTFADLGYVYNNSNLEIYDTNKAYALVGLNYHF